MFPPSWLNFSRYLSISVIQCRRRFCSTAFGGEIAVHATLKQNLVGKRGWAYGVYKVIPDSHTAFSRWVLSTIFSFRTNWHGRVGLVILTAAASSKPCIFPILAWRMLLSGQDCLGWQISNATGCNLMRLGLTWNLPSVVLKSDLPQHWSALKVRAWKALAAEISRESLRKSYLAILLSCLVFLSVTCDKETGLTDFQFKPASVIFSISALPCDSTRTKRVATRPRVKTKATKPSLNSPRTLFELCLTPRFRFQAPFSESCVIPMRGWLHSSVAPTDSSTLSWAVTWTQGSRSWAEERRGAKSKLLISVILHLCNSLTRSY